MTDRNSSQQAETLSTRAAGALRDVDIEEARTTLRQAQTALAALGYEVGDHGDPAQAVDGVWGDRTRQAVLNFQSDQGLTRSGQLDEATLAALLDTESEALDTESSDLEDEGATREAAEQMMRPDDRASVNDVLEGIEPTDADEELLN